MTTRAKHVFVVKEFVTAEEKVEPWLMLQLVKQPELPVLGRGFLGFDLKAGTSNEEAEALAAKLNEMIVATTYTDPHAEADRINKEGEELRRRKQEGRLN